jgi:hypothetical protein
MTNTLGTAVGVTLYRCTPVRVAWTRVTTYSVGVLANLQRDAMN